jgi:hypothetical protein
MSFIVLGLLVMFNQVSKVFRGGMAQVDIMAGGRAVMDTILRDMEQIAPTQAPNTVNFFVEGSPFFNPPFVQGLPPVGGLPGPLRTNVIQNLFYLSRYNQDWTATGYKVIPLPGTILPACVGSLYRFTSVTRTNLARTVVDFRNAITNLNLVADGVVHFRAVTFATNGFPIQPNPGYAIPTNAVFLDAQDLAKNSLVKYTFSQWNAGQVDCDFLSNAVPAYVELELGILEPPVLERFRSIGDPTAQRNYLSNHIGQVHLFRQRIAVRNVDYSAYVYP